MDFIRNNQIIQIFFFAVVVLLGIFLYSGGPAQPNQNTYNYLEINPFEVDDESFMRDDGFVVQGVNVERLSKAENTIRIIITANVEDTCTTLVEKKNTYTDRTFNIELKAQQKVGAICQGRETQIQTVLPIELGRLTKGTYQVAAQSKSISFDIEEVMTDAATSTASTTTEGLTEGSLSDILNQVNF